MPKVSIIIPFYNCPYIDQAINSALQQTHKDIEVIVVSDGSTKFLDKLLPYKEYITLIEKENGGTGSALNTGILNATGKYFAWLSSDDLFLKEKVERQLAFMKKKKTSFSYSNYSCINEQNTIIREMAGMTFYANSERLLFLSKQNSINGCTVMMKMKVFDQIGLFNEKLQLTQDYDYWLRVVQHYDLTYVHEILVHYRIHEKMGTKQNKELLLSELNMVSELHKKQLGPIIKKALEITPLTKKNYYYRTYYTTYD